MNLVLIARIAGERVAIDAEEVEAVVEIEAITPVPGSAPHVAGLAALRSRVLTVIDARAALGAGAHPPSEARDAIVVVADGHPYALLADTVEDVVESDGEVSPVSTRLTPGWAGASRGTVVAEGDLLLLADVHALIAGPAGAAA